MRWLAAVVAGSACLIPSAPLLAQGPNPGRVRGAVERALPAIQISLETFNDNKPTIKQFPTCVSCHHEAMGLTTLAFVRRRGFEADAELEKTQASHILDFLEKMRTINTRAAGGDEAAKKQADPFGDLSAGVGSLVGSLIDHGHAGDASTRAAALVLLKDQREDGRWTFRNARVPTQSSDFTTTAAAVRVLKAYAPASHAAEAGRAVGRGRAWLLSHTPVTTDDKAYRLLGLVWTGAEPSEVRKAIQTLRAGQRADGGWSQTPDPASGSDAYATGLSLSALHQAGVHASDPAYRRGLTYLLDTQAEDGTWHVAKRARALQKYFDAGFPYGHDQYISLPGTCWATIALAAAVDPPR